ncbi:MAG: hypothetical protein HQK98_04360 [Nitrospirae bacterium]|nr:hypothetical protein [Nitrospirota bacterium]
MNYKIVLLLAVFALLLSGLSSGNAGAMNIPDLSIVPAGESMSGALLAGNAMYVADAGFTPIDNGNPVLLARRHRHHRWKRQHTVYQPAPAYQPAPVPQPPMPLPMPPLPY